MTRVLALIPLRCETPHCGREFIPAPIPAGYYCDVCAEFRRVVAVRHDRSERWLVERGPKGARRRWGELM